VVAVRDHQQTSFVVYIDFLIPDVNNERRFSFNVSKLMEERVNRPRNFVRRTLAAITEWFDWV